MKMDFNIIIPLTVIFITLIDRGSSVILQPLVDTQPKQISVYEGNTAVTLECQVENKGVHDVNWLFVEHNLQISKSEEILIKPNTKYSIVRGPADSNSHVNLQIHPIQMSDNGHYKCYIPNTQQSVIHKVTVMGAPSPPPQQNYSNVDFTDCCKKEKVSASCMPVCSPGTSSPTQYSYDSCAADLKKILKCGSDGRNHAGCCRRKLVPAKCLDFCMNFIPSGPTEDFLFCLNKSLDIAACFMEGQVTLPSPPISVSALVMQNAAILVSWQAPVENANIVTGYRVLYGIGSPFTATDFKATDLIPSTQFKKIVQLPDYVNKYTIYVIAISAYGSSLPSNMVEAMADDGKIVSDRDKTIAACCTDSGVSSTCTKTLCGSNTLRQMNPTDINNCFADLSNVFSCLTGKRNHTNCCRRYDVPDNCLPFCSGSLPTPDFSMVKCMFKLPIIDACIQEGIKYLPAPPNNTLVTAITDSSAVLQWTSDASTFVVQYRETDTLVQQPYVEVIVNGKSFAFFNLKSSTFYEARISTKTENGTSLPSNLIYFLTYPDTSVLTTPPDTTVGPPPNYNLTGCCVKANVKQECLFLCDYSVTLTTDLSTSIQLISCVNDLEKIIKCGADGRDHTACCKRKGIQDICDPLCSAAPHTRLSFDASMILLCGTRTQDIINCYSEGNGLLPRFPGALRLTNSSKHTLSIKWQEPPWGPRPSSYLVQYKMNDGGESKNATTTNTFFIIQSLKVATVYYIEVFSVNSNGRSSPSPALIVSTDYDGAVSPPPTGSPHQPDPDKVWTNRTECCKNANFSAECAPRCTTGRFDNDLECVEDLDKAIACATDGRNHLPCCKRRNLPEPCWPYCKGQTPSRSFSMAMCFSYTPTIISCFTEGIRTLPSPPINFYLTNITTESVVFYWDPSTVTNANEISYVIKCIPVKNDGKHIIRTVDKSPYMLQGLKPLTRYNATLYAENKFGESLPTPTISFLTFGTGRIAVNVFQKPSGVISENSTVTISCHATGDPFPEVYWMFNNKQVSTNYKYTIESVKKEDAGLYTCIADNKIAVVGRKPLTLNVRFKPFLENVQDSRSEPNKGLTATMSCVFRGFPTGVQWSKSGAHLTAKRYQSFTQTSHDKGVVIGILKINGVIGSDFGKYTCTGTNTYGDASGSLNLIDTSVTTTQHPVIPTKKPPGGNNATACCVNQNISTLCLDLCTFDVDLTKIISNTKYYQCAVYVSAYMMCAADGRDHTKCCKQKGVDDRCVMFCSGIVGDVTAEHLPCATVTETTNNILECIESGLDKIPSQPTNVQLQMTGNMIVVKWTPPEKNGDKIQFYEIIYGITDGNQNHHKTTPSNKEYSIYPSANGDTYEIYVLAGNHHGVSHKAGPFNITVTGFVPTTTPIPVGPKVDNMTDCCLKKNITPTCTELCRLDIDFDTVLTNADYMPCLNYFTEMITCAADGRNHEPCCKANSVDSFCFRICNGIDFISPFEVRAFEKCVPFSEKIFSCITKGRELIPHKPTDLSFSYSSGVITVTWKAPDNVNLVHGYKLAYTIENVPISHTFQVPSTDFKITPAVAGVEYHISVYSQNKLGEESHPQIGSFSVPKSVNHTDIKGCCKSKGLPSVCVEACHFAVDINYLIEDQKYAQCFQYIPLMIECAADGRNHQQCCEKNNVEKICYPFCNGMDPINLSADKLLPCIKNANTILKCLEKGQLTIPTPPQNVVAVLKNGVIEVSWQPPKNYYLVTYYQVQYLTSVSGSMVHKAKRINSNTATNLKETIPIRSEITYTIWIIAGNIEGTSQRSPNKIIAVKRLHPYAPIEFHAERVTDSMVKLYWTVPSQIKFDNCIVYYKPTSEQKYLKRNTRMSSIRLEHLAPGVQYEGYVLSNNSFGVSEPSNNIYFYSSGQTPSKQKSDDMTGTKVGLGIGLAIALILLIVFVVVAGFFFLRRKKQSRFPSTVAFENPSYSARNPVQISGLPRTQVQSADHQFGYAPLDNDHDTEPHYSDIASNGQAKRDTSDTVATLNVDSGDHMTTKDESFT